MNKIIVSDEEFIYYLHEEWERKTEDVWLSTQAFREILEERGIVISWNAINKRLKRYYKEDKIRKIETSFGLCWMSKGEEFKL